MESVLNSYPSLFSSRSSSALSRPTALLPFPCQTNHLACSISVSTDSRSSEPIILLPNTDRCAALTFIAMWEPIENAPTNQLTALDCFVELTRVVADQGHAFVDAHTVSAEEPIQPRCRRGDFLVHIR